MENVLPEISVIVPVYNSELFLEECVESILQQSFLNFELLLIDDGSTDLSGKICDDYSKKDGRIRVFHKNNGGVSSTRNYGIRESKGKWITFVDSDDIIKEDYLRNLHNGLDNCPDNHVLVMGSCEKNGKNKIKITKQVLSGAIAVRYILDNNILTLSGPVSKLFSSNILSDYDITFPESIQMGEDGIFFQRYLNVIETISFVDSVDYIARDTANSLSKKYYDFNKEWECYRIWKEEIFKYVTKYSKSFTDINYILWNNRIGQTFFRCLCSIAYQQPRWSILKQLQKIRSLSIEDYAGFRFYETPNLKDNILKWTIDHRLFILFIVLLNISKLKNKIKTYFFARLICLFFVW